ncbi:MAG: hypothetical protein QXJ70_05775, partial [Acidilobaceae archaeon]
WAYVYSFMTYETVNDIVYELARAYWLQDKSSRPEITEDEERLLIAKVLQGNSWDKVEEILGSRMYKLVAQIKETIRKAAKHYFNLSEDKSVGLTIKDLKEEELTS